MPRQRTFVSWILAASCAATFVVATSAKLGSPARLAAWQDPVQDPVTDPAAGRGAGRQGGGAGAPRPYAQVVTSAMKTTDGVFKVHRGPVNGTDSVLFEIPKAQLDKDFVWNVQIKKTTIGAGYGGQNVSSHVVRWTKRGDRILLESIDYSITADEDPVVARAVENANYPAIIRSFPVQAYSANQDPVIDVSPIIMEQTPEFSAAAAIGGRGADNSRSFLERATAFPQNVNIEVTLTYTGNAAGGGGGGGGGRGGGAPGMRGSSGTVLVHHSMMKLPEKPMMSRKYDERVGFETEGYVDFGTDEHRSVRETIINRFRLEKKDAGAAMSEPLKPIIFYIDPATPAKYVKYVKQGVEAWQAAFEQAGFKNAIQAATAPDDPTWSAEDARYSVVHWAPTRTEAQSFINDPRSGEILSASIDVYPNVEPWSATSYFVQAGAVDKRAQKLPLPDEIQGALLQAQVSHQIGHALGFPHNLKSSSFYTVAQVRDPKWVKENGFVPSIMDEMGSNYVAQPEDNVDPLDLIPKVGPYDRFAIKWGYTPIPSAKNADAEKTTLDQWARQQDATSYLRFSTEGAAAADPGENANAIGDADAVMSATLGLKNLKFVAGIMFPATSSKVGDPWDDLEAVYNRMVTQWSDEIMPVVKIVGGEDSRQVHIGQQGLRFNTVPKARQVAAVQFLMTNAFTPPLFMIDPKVLRLIQASGAVDKVRTTQTAILTALLQNQRIDRMTEQATLDQSIAYTPLQFLGDVRRGIWSEIATPGTAITLYRRNLQRAYLELMDQKLNGTPASSEEIRMLVKGELRALDAQLKTAAAAPTLEEATKRHLNDAREEIATILDPRVPRPEPAAGAAGAAAGRGRGGLR